MFVFLVVLLAIEQWFVLHGYMRQQLIMPGAIVLHGWLPDLIGH